MVCNRGKNDCKILIPSNGGTGIKLKNPREIFIQTIKRKRFKNAFGLIPRKGKDLKSSIAIPAIKKLVSIPAEATQLSAYLPFRL